MRRIFILIVTVLLLTNCNNKQNTVQSTDQRKSDSLRTAADSLAMFRNIRAMQSGMHIHNNGDLAAAAHQDPKKTQRIKEAQRERREARIAAEKRRNEAIQAKLKEHRAAEGN